MLPEDEIYTEKEVGTKKKSRRSSDGHVSKLSYLLSLFTWKMVAMLVLKCYLIGVLWLLLAKLLLFDVHITFLCMS